MVKCSNSMCSGGGVTHNSLIIRVLTIFRGIKNNEFGQDSPHPYHFPIQGEKSEPVQHVKKAAFTLPEILITIGVIGIVAAMTLPNLLYSVKEKRTVTQLQQAYSILNNAVRMTTVENGPLNIWAGDSIKFLADEMSKHLKIIQTCGASYPELIKCSPAFTYASNGRHFILANGVSVQVRERSTNQVGGYYQCKSSVGDVLSYKRPFTYATKCGFLVVDINGPAKPNKKGEDVFSFNIFTDGILPKGGGYYEVWHDTFEKGCLGDDRQMCTGWVLKNKNLDYLRCPDDLVWGKVTSCPKK